MKAVSLMLDKDAPFLAEDHFDNNSLTNFEAELMRVHYDQWEWVNKGVEIDPWVTLDEIDVVLQTGAIPVDKLKDWANFFNNLGCEWIEEHMRSSMPQFAEEAEYAKKMSDAWYKLEAKVLELKEVVDVRLGDIHTETTYEMK